MATIVLTIVAELAEHRAGRVGDDRLDAADVVGQAALDLTGARLGEEAQGHALEVRVEGVAQVLHDVLADELLRYVWPTPISPLMMGRTIIRPDVQVQVLEVAGGEDVVDEQLEQERVDQADERS